MACRCMSACIVSYVLCVRIFLQEFCCPNFHAVVYEHIDASIGTIAVIDACGYKPPTHTPSKAVLGVVRGRWSVAGRAERG